MTKTELLALIVGEARKCESADGTRQTVTKDEIAEVLVRDLKVVLRYLERQQADLAPFDEPLPSVRRDQLVRVAGDIISFLVTDLTADREGMGGE